MLFFNKMSQTNFIEYLYLVKGIKYYNDNYGNIRSQEAPVVVRFLPHENYFGIVRKNEKDGKVVIVNENTNLETILNNLTNDTYLVKAEDLNYTNYTTYEKIDELYPSKKKLFKKVA